jgi:DNA repair protein RecN (Recombination protein N)
MLNELVVEGLGVIDRAELSLERGCCALTGETGAGKTLLVAALSLLLGARAERTMVREGAGRARIEGRFTVGPSHPAAELLRAHGVIDDEAGDEVELIVSRLIEADGRTGKARINGRMVTISVLEEAGAMLGEIASQHAHRRLGSSSAARRILDSYAGAAAVALADEVATAVRRSARARRLAEELRGRERERTREFDILRYEVAEIEAAAPSVGETERLTNDARRLENAEALAVGIENARSSLHGEGGASEQIARAVLDLGRVAEFDARLTEFARRLEAAGVEIADVAADLAGSAALPDAQDLEETRDRLSLLARLRRKYGDDEASVLAYLERAKARAMELESTGSDLTAAEEEATRLEEQASKLASQLSGLRRAAAPKLERAAGALLAQLALPGGRVEVALEEHALYEGGLETVELRVAANPGEVPRPVAKAASGGELSRISLALHMLTSSHTAETMVFDEVDAGIGGEAAHSVGRLLARLGDESGAQVLVVTHLPQVAAHARSHLRVSKSESGGRVTAAVKKVEGEERIAELSRMLAGLPASERARGHAQELLEVAGGRVGAA